VDWESAPGPDKAAAPVDSAYESAHPDFALALGVLAPDFALAAVPRAMATEEETACAHKA